MTFVKMPKYLATNKYQNKDILRILLKISSYYGKIRR